MATKLHPDFWVPQGIDELEAAAEDAVRSDCHTLVVAGPGAGKTELLAQRGCYLLQTRVCPRHKRILAISFKRDAARNLQDRIRARCGEELSRRFHSMTFDAFAKSVVDRFGQALPERWRPRPDFAIDFTVEGRFRELLNEIPRGTAGLSVADVNSIMPSDCYKRVFVGRPLRDYPDVPTTTLGKAALAVWQMRLHAGTKSALNFAMIGRLAEHVLSTNPKILAALRDAYAYIFLDEFQDATSIHYDLTKTAFLNSNVILTAVGDTKQSIMRWAMALRGVFQTFQADFSSDVKYLRRNYRSAPRLVSVIASLTAAMDPDADSPEAVDDGKDGAGECRVLLFPNNIVETKTLAGLVKRWITVEGLAPRDICILTRQKPEKYAGMLIETLNGDGIKVRVENVLQDLLTEPATTYLLDCFKLAVRPQAPESWQRLVRMMLELRGDDADRSARAVTEAVTSFKRKFAKAVRKGTRDSAGIGQLVHQAIDLVSYHGLVAQHPRYEQGTFLKEQLALFSQEMAKYEGVANWSDAIDQFEGLDAIPAMTIHKSKGLEYHTIVFVGLEDYVFRGFKQIEDDEEMCAFFVAFSRAEKRVLFTFSKDRQGTSQSIDKIRPLYDLLIAAGIKPEAIKA